ncbi:MAG: DNA-binding protein [Prevotella sp.]|jgi:hypothetical protein|nr:DNA-binding protein [Prevotella sp.]
MLKLDFYKNKRQGDQNYGKIYARAKNAEPINLEQLANHMCEHNTPFSPGVIKGILTDMVSCIKEMVLLGQPVKIDGLAIFKAAVTSKPANDVESFDLDSNIRNVRLQCRAVGKLVRKDLTNEATLGYTSLAMRVKSGEIILSSRKGEYIATE